MLSILFYFLFYIPTYPVDANGPSLDTSLIPDSLLINAHAVIRFENTICEIKSLQKKVVKKEKAITILDDKGVFAGVVSIIYTDKAEKIKNLEIEIYNSKGKLFKEIKKKEIDDLSIFDGFSIAGDARRKYYSYTSNVYPYTIKYKYEKESENTLWIPSWFPITSTGISVEHNQYKIITSVRDHIISYKERNLVGSFIDANTDNHIYEALNIKAIKNEDQSPHYLEFLPMIRFMPNKFNYFGIEGSFSNWKMYGQWMYDNMLKGRGDIPGEVIEELDAIIPAESSKEDIARIVYDYVTESTRYVSVQLGAGGYRPIVPSEVYKLKYGDCKALSFYTANILKHYNIEAIYTEIMSTWDYALGYDEDIPGPGQGNHIVLCLPNEGDTTWLECTTKSTFFGYAHSGIDNRQALLITPEGGKLITTTKYSSSDNLAVKKAQIEIGANNIVQIKFDNTYHNQRHEPWSGLIKEMGKSREDILRKHFFDHLPKYELVDYEIEANKKEKLIREEAEMRLDNLVETAGDYIILPYMVEYIYKPSKLDMDRIQEIYIKNGKSDNIEILVAIPDGYTLVEKEKNLNFLNTFGSLKVKKEIVSEEKIKISVDIVYNEGSFAPSLVTEHNLFAEKLSAIIDDKIIFKPK